MKPIHELSEIVHLYGSEFLRKHPQSLQKLKTLDVISKCRTSALGGRKLGCSSCGIISYQYNSCRNRHCPKCQTVNRERWILQRESELLPVTYFHTVFTLPHELGDISREYP